jgi:hypothetical protein
MSMEWEASGMDKLRTFASEWPHVVNIKGDWPAAHVWLGQWCRERGLRSGDIFTSIRYQEYGFKDPQLAMLFKLKFA